jgi:hypothetical protein
VSSGPKLTNAGSSVGSDEVLHQLHAKDAACASGDIGIAAEVGKYLRCEGHCPDDEKRRLRLAGDSICRIRQRGEPIGNHKLLEKTPGHEAQPIVHSCRTKSRLTGKPWEKVVGAFDRSGDALRKEEDV